MYLLAVNAVVGQSANWFSSRKTRLGSFKRIVMEKELDKVVEEIISTPNVFGCLIADHQGLCLASRGTAHVDSAGLIVALSEQACKIQPNLKPPTVCLETDTKQCLIQRHGTITGAIYKQKPL